MMATGQRGRLAIAGLGECDLPPAAAVIKTFQEGRSAACALLLAHRHVVVDGAGSENIARLGQTVLEEARRVRSGPKCSRGGKRNPLFSIYLPLND